jgi:phosphohistidine swiveling domain-containing protein
MDALFSKMLKAGSTTYFMDVKEAKNNKKYLTVTASQPAKEGDKKFAKRSVIVFSSVADEFVGALKEANTVIHGEGAFTKTLKSGKINYFVDVKEAKNNTRYVSITESQPSKEDPKKFAKRSITVFNNAANDFVGAIEEAVGHLKQ